MLDRMCACYLSVGVSYEEFWHGDYTQLKFMVEKHRIEMENKNREMWVQGFYVYDAISTALHNAFRNKGTPPESYRKEPVRVTEMSETEKEAEQQKTLERFKAQLIGLTGRLERREAAREKEAEAKKGSRGDVI